MLEKCNNRKYRIIQTDHQSDDESLKQMSTELGDPA